MPQPIPPLGSWYLGWDVYVLRFENKEVLGNLKKHLLLSFWGGQLLPCALIIFPTELTGLSPWWCVFDFSKFVTDPRGVCSSKERSRVLEM